MFSSFLFPKPLGPQKWEFCSFFKGFKVYSTLNLLLQIKQLFPSLLSQF